MGLDLDALNPRQRDAVTAPPGPLLVRGGPGTGKTTVLAWRLAYVIDAGQVDPRHVLAVSFTRRAARELRQRAQDLCPAADAATIGTLHSVGFRLLRRWGERLDYDPGHLSVISRDDQVGLVRLVLDDLGLDAGAWPAEDVAEQIGAVKREGGAWDEPEEPFDAIFAGFLDLARRHNLLDFDDLIALPLRLMRECAQVHAWACDHYRVVLVDEFQDLDPAQHALIGQIAGRDGALTLVGDPAQSLYSWRGAASPSDAALRANFPRLRVVELDRSYRSTAAILAVAAALGTQTASPVAQLRAIRGKGKPVTLAFTASDRGEAKFVADELRDLRKDGAIACWGACAVLYRARWQGDAIAAALEAAGIPARRADAGDLLRTPEAGDLLAYLRIVVNPADTLALARAIDRPPRGLAALARAMRAGRLRTLDDLAGHGPSLLARRSARTHLAAFLDLQRDLAGSAVGRSPAAILTEVIARTDYARWLDDVADGAARRANVARLVALAEASDAEDLAEFLAEVAGLPVDGEVPERDAVVLSTIHRAKGLEFSVVFVVGMAEELLPQRRSIGDPDAVAEEARLAYVATTRARDRLYLSVPLALERGGRSRSLASSRFLDPLRGKPLRIRTV